VTAVAARDVSPLRYPVFSVTALGHQGWLIGTGRTHVLIDPVLTDRFSRMPLSGARVFPPRRLDLASLPPIDAVLISHEHPDHLDFVSLQHLAQRTRVYISAHSSEAARSVIASLGLTVESLSPGVELFIGDLVVLPLAPTAIGEPGSNEIDVVPLLIRDRAGHGSFFSSIDLFCGPALVREVRRHLDRPGVWAEANSGYDRGIHYTWCKREPDPVPATARRLAQRYASLFRDWGHPEMVFVTDNGLTLGGAFASLNDHVFEVDNEALIEELHGLLPGHGFLPALPGMTVELVDGALRSVHPERSFLATAAIETWPARGGAPPGDAQTRGFGPGTGRRTLGPSEWATLEAALGRFARFLFARVTYRGLYQLTASRDHDGSRKPTCALVLRDGDSRVVWELVPQRCAFVRVACADPEAEYVAGAELWASDVLAVVTFEAAADDLFHFGGKRLWNVASAAFSCDLDTELELFVHALREPQGGERVYRQSLDASVRPTIPTPDGGPTFDQAGHWEPPRRPPIVRPVPPSVESSTAASGAPSPSSSGSGSPLPESVLSALRDAIARGSSGAWSLGSAGHEADGVRATLVTPTENLVLHICSTTTEGRHYRRIGGYAFRYSPGAISLSARTTLDGVIAAVAALTGLVSLQKGTCP
jgi:Beta-lactamase superfamily domain